MADSTYSNFISRRKNQIAHLQTLLDRGPSPDPDQGQEFFYTWSNGFYQIRRRPPHAAFLLLGAKEAKEITPETMKAIMTLAKEKISLEIQILEKELKGH